MTDARRLNLPPSGDGGVADPFAEPEPEAKPKPTVRVSGADRLRRQHERPDPARVHGADPEPSATPEPVVTRQRGAELARKLRARGVSSARWVAAGGHGWHLDVLEEEEAAARDALTAIVRQEGRLP